MHDNQDSQKPKKQLSESNNGIARLLGNPKELARYQFGLTCESAIQGNSIALIKKDNPVIVEDCFEILLSNLLDGVNVNNKFTAGAIPMITQAIIKKFWYFTLDEFAYVLQKGLVGDYKKQYNKLDLETLLDWCIIYDTMERMEYVEKRNHNQRIEQEKEMKETISHVSKEFIQDIIHKTVGDPEKEERDYQEYKQTWLDGRNKSE